MLRQQEEFNRNDLLWMPEITQKTLISKNKA
jgi:hypothetical protein